MNGGEMIYSRWSVINPSLQCGDNDEIEFLFQPRDLNIVNY